MNDGLVAIIDNNTDLTETLAMLLLMSGFESVVATVDELHTQVLVEAFLTKHDARTVIFEVGHPYKEGLDLFNTFREGEALKGRRFILLSTCSDLMKMDDLPMGVMAVLEKPFVGPELIAVLMRP